MKMIIISFVHRVVAVIAEPQKRKAFARHIITAIPRIGRSVSLFTTFFLLLALIIGQECALFLRRLPVVGLALKPVVRIWSMTLQKPFAFVVKYLDTHRSFKVRRSYLISIALSNLLARKSRSFVTILGMSIGVGIIVYLLSLGYGIERLVIEQVVSLDELAQVDVVGSEKTSLKIDTTAVEKIQKISGVSAAMPLVSIVGRLNYENAKVDIVVNAVTPEYLQSSPLNFLKGTNFQEEKTQSYAGGGSVAGVSKERLIAAIGTPVSDQRVFFNIIPFTEAGVWESCSIHSAPIGVTKRIEGGYEGSQWWGSEYAPFEPYGREAFDPEALTYAGRWVRAKVPLFTQTDNTRGVPIIDDTGRQLWVTGCIPRKYLQITDEIGFASVLGEATASASLDTETASKSAEPVAFETQLVSTDSAGIEIVELVGVNDDAAVATEPARLAFQNPPTGTAVISSGLMKLLNISLDAVLDRSFLLSFIVTRSLMPEVRAKTLTEEATYKIVGVVEDDNSQYMYVPFSDMQSIGVPNYSQVKVVVEEKNNLQTVRREIETLGFVTASAVDTVAQIEQLFANLRIILVLIGLIALGVAALGMFNTLTVSLLERTREIGGMKTIGMIMAEIEDLFLAEAMIMGFAGGLGGLFLGFSFGKLTSAFVSIIAISNGTGYLNLTYIPFFLIAFILACSFIIGLLTGLYPAYRAKKISALNALRYE